MTLFFKPLVLVFMFSVFSIESTQAQGRQVAAHVHGVNQLQMVKNDNKLFVIYRMPLGQLEEAKVSNHVHDEHFHAHGKESDHKTSHEAENRLEDLKDYDQLFSASGITTQCELTDFNFELYAVSADKDDPHAGHKDAILEYQFNCRHDWTLSAIKIKAFNLFKGLERVDFEGLLDGVGVTESTFSDDTRVEF